MKEFITWNREQRRRACEEAVERLKLPATSIEKDFWVCLILKELFNLPEWGEHLVFKGGTALSKAWRLIDRFSEDVDLVIHRAALGFGGEDAPELAPSKKQLRKRLDELKVASQQAVQLDLNARLQERLSVLVPDAKTWELTCDPDDPDKQTLLFQYPSAFAGDIAYIRPVVKMEFGARSDTEPTKTADIQSFLAEAFPDQADENPVQVRTVAPIRTFWEKAMLLHEETCRPAGRTRKVRMSRHYYDLHRLIDAGVGKEAAADLDLFQRIASHREVYFRYTWMDYKTLRPGSLRLVPPNDQLADWKTDYAAMREQMLFGEIPEFEQLMESAATFQDTFNEG